MPVIKFESYNASDVRLDQTRQKKLAGAELRGVVAAYGAGRRAAVSLDQWRERR